MKYEVVFITGQSPSNQILSRFAGVHRLATELRNVNISTKVLIGLGYYDINDYIQLVDNFIDEKTLVLGVSTTFFVEYSTRYSNCHTTLYNGQTHISDMQLICNWIKSKYPAIKIVVGGPSARKRIKDFKNIDLIVEGYADVLLKDYVQSIKERGRCSPVLTTYNGVPFISNPLGGDFDFRNSKILFEDEDGIMPGETLPLEISRGCIFRCKFCSFPLRGKSVSDNSYLKCEDNIKNELMRNYEKWGTTTYTFVDDTFNDSVEKLSNLHKIITSLPFKLKFSAYIRADLLHAYPETIDMMHEMGIVGAFFGIESLNDRARKTASKGFSAEKNLRVLETVNKKWTDTVITSSFIYGLPNDTPDTMRQWTEQIFNCGVFDNHDVIVQPLYLLGSEATYATDFDKEMDKHGYEYVGGGTQWTNTVTTFKEMVDMSEDTHRRLRDTVRPFGGFQFATLLGYGIPFEKLRMLNSNSVQDIDYIENLTKQKFNHYLDIIKNDSSPNNS
jgi:radical SAM superfamily enzyme YgiQ (UPF0313 family)